MKKILNLVYLILFLIVTRTLCQYNDVYPQPVNLITNPTAGTIPRGSYLIETRLFKSGGITAGIYVGLTTRFMFGISYGGNNIIGDSSVNLYEQPGIELKYRVIEEKQNVPAILIGFTSQGYGKYDRTLDRYETKAKGFYIVASKNYRFLGNTGFHFGINYNNLEIKDNDKDPSFFCGIDKEINPELTLMVEYDAALNDNETNEINFGKGKGYLNAGIRWTFVQKFHLELDFNNILLNRRNVEYFSREIKITFIEFF
ncbi:MAG: YjbH domain-containing protein [Candidatus Marinimicrobia bacterium]|nr:YjbH domain-containing protein [Candidatus Neomarinimicrobiota bacterium]